MKPRLREKYEQKILPALRETFNYPNLNMVPRLEKVVVNMGVGDANQDPRFLESALAELASITGQKPAVRKARKSISNFKLRAGQSIGCTVTLRSDRMYEFVDRLFSVAIPRIRDFRGIPTTSFDTNHNFTLGIREQTIFPEVDLDSVQRVRGMNVTFVIRHSRSREESLELLSQFGMPFRQPAQSPAAAATG